MNVLLTEDGRHYQHTGLNGGRTLVIDIGGFTDLTYCMRTVQDRWARNVRMRGRMAYDFWDNCPLWGHLGQDKIILNIIAER